MKYDIEYQCGHTATVALFGSSKDRERKIEYMRSGICPKCKTDNFEKEQGLSELTGVSEKQIEYGRNKRMEMLTSVLDNQKYWEDMLADEKKEQVRVMIEKQLHAVTQLVLRTKQIKSASWWLDMNASGLWYGVCGNVSSYQRVMDKALKEIEGEKTL